MLPERVYKFDYNKNGKIETRIALPLEMRSEYSSKKINVYCHDFVRQDVRCFSWDRISNVEDVTNKCVVGRFPDHQMDTYERLGLSLFEHSNGTMYVVKV